MNHTPGPWEAMEMPKGSSGMRIFAGEQYLAFVGDTDGLTPSKENAKLIAAAPTMLEVLEEIDECAAYWSEYDVPLGLHERIKEAIAKARGEI